ncbi:CPM.2 family protein [Megaselia abdita]
MSRGVACKSQTPAFENGITNGAAWYPLTGGMQDYNYVWYGCMEVTLEISCCKFPPAYELKKYWDDNQLSLIKFLAEAHRGVQGFIFDGNTGKPVERASLKVKGRDVGFQTTKHGEFWRVLMPGLYKLEVYAEGYTPREIEFMVVDQHPTLLNVTLQTSKRQDSPPFYRPNGPIPAPSHQHQLYRPVPGSHSPPPPPAHAPYDGGILSTLSSGLNSLYSNIFG